MKKIKTVIIDDEINNRELISKMIFKISNQFEILGSAADVNTGIDLIYNTNPDLVLLDIKMTDGTGFDLLNKIINPNFEVVFITGFDNYALQAFEYNALDYVLKPIDVDKFKTTLFRVQNRIIYSFKREHSIKDVSAAFDHNSLLISKLSIHFKDKVYFIELSKIISIQSNNGFVVVNINDGTSLTSSRQLSDFEFILNSYKNFIKINKSVYVNALFIKNYTKGNICLITMNDNSSFEISRRKKTEIINFLQEKIKITG